MADLSDIVQGDYSQVDESTLCFETIPIYKIILFSILTLGLYQDFWFYRNWKILKIKFGYKISPFWRTLGTKTPELFTILAEYFKKFNIKSFNAESLKKWYERVPGWTLLILSALAIRAFCGVKNFELWLMVSFINVIISIIISIFNTTIIIAIIQSKINKVNEENFSTVPINKLCGIKAAVLLFIGNLISFILAVVVVALILYALGHVKESDSSSIFSKLHSSNNIYISKPFNWNQPPYPYSDELLIKYQYELIKYQYELGVIYEMGKEVPQDLAKACEYYKKVVIKLSELQQLSELRQSLDYPLKHIPEYVQLPEQQSLDNLKKQKINIKEVPQDLAKACEYYKEVIKASPFFMLKIDKTAIYTPAMIDLSKYSLKYKIISSQYELGVRYEMGKDVPQDLSKACEYYKKVAAQLLFYQHKIMNIRNIWEPNRELEPQKLQFLYELIKQEVSKGSIVAKYKLGIMYEEGIGISQDLVKACEYYKEIIESDPAFMFWYIKLKSSIENLPLIDLIDSIKKSSENSPLFDSLIDTTKKSSEKE